MCIRDRSSSAHENVKCTQKRRSSLVTCIFNPDAPENRFRMMILSHAAICTCLDDECIYDPTCTEYKDLLLHMEDCPNDHCGYPNCRPTKEFVTTMQVMTEFQNSNSANIVYDHEEYQEERMKDNSGREQNVEAAAAFEAEKDYLVESGAIAPVPFLECDDDKSIESSGTWFSNPDAVSLADDDLLQNGEAVSLRKTINNV
mgnify:CR=1 FL=1